MNKNNAGFTLIELSLVVGIIALVIGGILVGENLIRGAQLRSVIQESQRYTQAVADFKDKYHSFPGDMATATNFWGTASLGTCPTGTGTGTCNGDGNGRITSQTSGTGYEQFRAWQHLSLGKFVDGIYSGVAGSQHNFDRVPDTNVPASRLSAAGWGLITMTIYDAQSGSYRNIPYYTSDVAPNVLLWLGGRSESAISNRMANVLKASEAKEIDTKVDDGLGGLGKVVGQLNGAVPYCFSTTDGKYDLTQTTKVCTLVFKTGL